MNWNDLSTDQELYQRIQSSGLYRAGDIASTFETFKTANNQSSYEALISGSYDLKGKTILDMPCGSGPLIQLLSNKVGSLGRMIGVDFNGDEIKKAQDSIRQGNVHFLLENVQRLSVASSSVDIIFCHLGLMLFNPLEPVIQSINRILRPGGLLVANLISSKNQSDLFKEYCHITRRYESHIQNAQKFSWGDSRINTDDGLDVLFDVSHGFAGSVEKTYYTVSHHDSPEMMLKLLRSFFQISYLLKEADRIACERELLAVLGRFQDKNGQVNFEIPFEKIVIRKMKRVLYEK